MKYKRPQDFETAERMIRAVCDVQVTGSQKEMQRALQRLFEFNWYTDAIKPLYDANAVVRMVMNSLVPIVQELILEKNAFDELERVCDPNKKTRYEAEYKLLRQKLLSAAPTRKNRKVTKDFERMAASMELYALDEEVQTALCKVYCLMKTARTALNLISSRISVALETHCEIQVSDDIPIEALSII